MHKKLSSSDIETYSSQAKKIYLKMKFPEQLCDKQIEADIAVLNRHIDEINSLEENPTIDNIIELTSATIEKTKSHSARFQAMGGTEAQFYQLRLMAHKLLEIDILKNIHDLHNKLTEEIVAQFHLDNQRQMEILIQSGQEEKAFAFMLSAVKKLVKITTAAIDLYANVANKTKLEEDLVHHSQAIQTGIKELEDQIIKDKEIDTLLDDLNITSKRFVNVLKKNSNSNEVESKQNDSTSPLKSPTGFKLFDKKDNSPKPSNDPCDSPRLQRK